MLKRIIAICLICAALCSAEQLMQFERTRIGDVTYEAASVFDVDKDGALDIVSGEYWFAGPTFEQSHKICNVQKSGDYYDDFSDFPMDVNGDGYLDIITGGWWGKTLRWRENPKGQTTQWQVHDIDQTGSIETTRFWDVDGDGFLEAVPNAGARVAVYKLIRDSEGKGTGEFEKYVIKEGGCGHGLGFGDINGDGRGDFVVPNGWIEAPANTFGAEWLWHPEFNLGTASVPTIVYDVNNDGKADLIVGQGHGYGLHWYEQGTDSDGKRTWTKHALDTVNSQYHEMMLADIDNDGEQELITGKRFRAHCGSDPGANDPLGLYYYNINGGKFDRVVLNFNSPATDGASGTGIYLWVEDIDGNGYKDVIAPGKEGLFLFKNLGPVKIADAVAKVKDYKIAQLREPIKLVEDLILTSPANSTVRAELAAQLAALLNEDVSYDCKDYVCRKLALIGTANEVPTLAKFLNDEKLSHMSRYALEEIADESATTALLSALDNTAGLVKIGIINSLGNRRSDSAVDKLATLLNSKEQNIANTTAFALGTIGTETAAKALKAALANARDTMIADAYMMCADKILAAGNKDSAEQIYEQIYNSDQPPMNRATALLGLANTDSDKIVSYTIEAISSDDLFLQRMAARVARLIDNPKAIAELTQKMPDLSLSGQVLLLSVLADGKSKTALPTVVKACDSSDSSVRIEALKALGKLGDASSVKLLAERSASADGEESEIARTSLERLQGAGVNAAMIKLMAKADTDVKTELINALGVRNATESADALLKIAGKDKRPVRIAAFKVLKTIAAGEHLPQLIELLITSGNRTGTYAQNAVVATISRLEDKSQGVNLVVAKYATVKDTKAKSSLIDVLGKVGDDAGLATLRAGLEDKKVKTASIRALSAWPNAEPAEDLYKTAKDSSDKSQRVLALRGYVRLIGLPNSRPAAATTEMYKKAMALASNANEKKMILSGLSNIKTVEAMELSAEYLSDKDLQQEAIFATVKIARNACGLNPRKVNQTLTTVEQITKDETILTQITEIKSLIEKFDDYITTWQVAGPYSETGKACKDLFSIEFAPENDPDSVIWRTMPAATNPEKPWLIDFLAELGGVQKVAYLRNKIFSDKQQRVRLEVGTDDGNRIWLNGQLVFETNVERGLIPNQDKVDITLNQGPNTLLIKVTQNVMGWELTARIRNLDGSKLENLRFETD